MTEKKETKRLPSWFKSSKGKLKATKKLATVLEAEVPNSICQEARCPNRSECFAKGVLTFMILGITCTRNCAFCSVTHGTPLPPNKNELHSILNAIEKLNLKFVVLTSPNRDDLSDGGAGHYAFIVSEIKKAYPHVKVEVLIPDFQADFKALETVIAARPDVVNHNMETVPSLYSVARRGSVFKRSLDVLKQVKVIDSSILSKSGVMVGLGEETDELIETFKHIHEQQVDILTVGQYLKPAKDNLDVAKYYHPDEFENLKVQAEAMGFPFVFSGPLVRSSYLADVVFEKTAHNGLKRILT
ncbi:lipoyl synthase [Candidatus Marinamargulisbacteria bacterium SCGC AG-343-D04]|nr:lipoyl synthase [Candidatus Marinamargulisbacteria bacterium SCGC AG-343-D04]